MNGSIWFLPFENVSQDEYKCVVCPEVEQRQNNWHNCIVKATSTDKLISHMQTWHRRLHDAMKSLDEKGKDVQPLVDAARMQYHKNSKPIEKFINTHQAAPSRTGKEMVLMAWAACVGLPFSELDHPAFRTFLHMCGGHHKLHFSSTLVRSILPGLKHVVKQEIFEILKNTSSVSITTGKFFLQLSKHFVCFNNNALVQFVLVSL